jgi:hypothetical protein
MGVPSFKVSNNKNNANRKNNCKTKVKINYPTFAKGGQMWATRNENNCKTTTKPKVNINYPHLMDGECCFPP